MPKQKTLKDSDLTDLLKSDRPDGLVILSPEDTEAITKTVEQLRTEIKKLKGKSNE